MENAEIYGTGMNMIKRNENTGCPAVICQFPQDQVQVCSIYLSPFIVHL